MKNDNNRLSKQRETCFQSDEIMDSMLAKWYQSEQDGDKFWTELEDRLNGKTTASEHVADPNQVYTQVKSNDPNDRNETNRLFGLDWFHFSLLAASLFVGGFVSLLIIAFDPPEDNVATAESASKSESPASIAKQKPNSAIGTSLQQPEPESMLCDDQDADENEWLLAADEIELFDQNTPLSSTTNSADIAVAEQEPSVPFVDSNAKQNSPKFDRDLRDKYLAARIDGAGSASSDAAAAPSDGGDSANVERVDKQPADAVYAQANRRGSRNYLSIAIEMNRSGYTQVSINDHVLAKKFLPAEAADLLKKTEPFFLTRMRVLAPRIGPTIGNIYIGTVKSGERLEFQSPTEFKDALATAVEELPKFKTKYRRRASIQFQTDRIMKLVTQRVDNLFQEWATNAINQGSPVFYSNDPKQRFVSILSEEDFRKFAKNGNFYDIEVGQRFVPATTMQKLASVNLRKRLAAEATEVGLFGNAEDFRQFQVSLRAMQSNKDRVPNEVITALIAARPDLKDLPLAMGDECNLTPERSEALERISRSIGPVLARFDAFSSRNPNAEPDIARTRNRMLTNHISKVKRYLPNSEDHSYQELLTVDQMLQIEQPEMRLELVKLLGQSKSKVSANLLACYVKYDLDPTVRMFATEMLSDFPAKWVRPKLMEGLRYPWPEAAKHSAEALVRLNDMKAIPELVELLRKSDPRRPKKVEGDKYVRTELVAINHLKNCLLCHADSTSVTDRGRAPVPEWERRLSPAYYNARPTGLVARADVTYLRQDFSVVHEVKDHGPWPANQRFDYVVRKSTLNQAMAEKIMEQFDDSTDQYHAATVFALQLLTEQKPTDNSYQNWKQIVTEMGFVL